MKLWKLNIELRFRPVWQGSVFFIYPSIILAVLIAGCGQRSGPQKRINSVTTIGSIIESPSMLEGKDLELAYAVCLSLRNKDTEFRSNRINQKFAFEIDHTDCSKNKSSAIINTTLQDSSGKLIWNVNLPTFYFKNVETHLVGMMAPLCNVLLKGQSSPNTYDEGDGKRQLTFVMENGKIKVVGKLAKRDGQGSSQTFGQMVVVREDTKYYSTGSQLSGVITGLESDQVQRIPCSNGSTETLRQIFLNHSAY